MGVNELQELKTMRDEFMGLLGETFGDEDGFVNTDMIDDILEMINLDLNFLIKIPIFRKYYEGKK